MLVWMGALFGVTRLRSVLGVSGQVCAVLLVLAVRVQVARLAWCALLLE